MRKCIAVNAYGCPSGKWLGSVFFSSPQKIGLFVGRIASFLVCVLLLNLRHAGAAEIDLEILKSPAHISRFAEFYVRVKVTNKGRIPLRGCDKSEQKCIAVGWEFAEPASVITLPGKNNTVSFQPYVDGYLLPGEAIEKSIRIPPAGLIGSEALLSVYAVVREGTDFTIKEQRLKMAIKPPPAQIQRRRVMVRSIVYGYLALSITLLGVLLFVHRSQS